MFNQEGKQIMNRKVLGWNINQRSGLGKEIPEFVLQELLEQDADVIVLTEVVKNDSLTAFIQKMCEAGYELHIPQELRIRSGGTERHSASN